MSSGKRLGEHTRRSLTAKPARRLDDRLAAAGQGCPNRPPCRHGDALHEDGMCTALNCYCGHSFRTTPSRGELWLQAYGETLRLPSWERQRRVRARYDELVAAAGLL